MSIASNFVNSNKPNMLTTHEHFENSVHFNKVDEETCFPVFLYKRNDVLVAWYDVENKCGYCK